MITLQDSSQIRSIPTHQEANPRGIKKYLEHKFKHKFSVRQGRGTASHWIDIRWTDGVSGNDVRAACGKFNDDEHDDMMTDLWCGSQYTTEQRSISTKAYIYCAYLLAKSHKMPLPKITTEVSKWSKKANAWIQFQDDVEMQESNGCRNYRFTEKLNLLIASTNFNHVNFKEPRYYEVTSERTGGCWVVYGLAGDIQTANKMAKEHGGIVTEVKI